MAHALTETPTEGSSVTVPDGGDARTAASVETPFQALANRAKYCENHIDALEAGVTELTHPTNGVSVPLLSTGASDWTNTDGVWFNAGVGATRRLIGDLPPTCLGTVTEIKVQVSGTTGAGAHSALPATVPKVWLYYVDPGSITPVAVGGQSDTSADVTAYNTVHYITYTLSHVLHTDRRYFVVIDCEAGTDSETGKLAVSRCFVKSTA